MCISEKTCFFTGHSTIPARELRAVVRHLHGAIVQLSDDGYTRFLSGGAIGFDLMAASLVQSLREQGSSIGLEFVLPCPDHDRHWGAEHKQLLKSLLRRADAVTTLGDLYTDGSMKRRNRSMADRSAACIVYLRKPAAVEEDTLRYARERGLRLLLL